MMRPEDHEPVCIVNGCGRTRVHRVGECAPDDAPTYSDGAEVQALVDVALTGGELTEVIASVVADHQRRVARGGACWCGAWPNGDGTTTYPEHVAAAVAARTSAAVKQARADERERIAQAVEAELEKVDGDFYWHDGCREGLMAAARIARGADL